DALGDGENGYVIDDDIKLAAKMMVSQWYLNPTGTGDESPADLGVEYLLFPLMEHTV
ncbi:phage gp6-like head-tail connector protein, partial [Salmonella enterica subsp. enterica serovar Typhimurium]|nr:phage gp6-like head-tail connector protein [Salmonella enterica subsp. enterica serovar Typhimurium]